MNGPGAPAAPVPGPGQVKLKSPPVVSRAVTVLTAVVAALGALLAGASAIHVGVHSTAPSTAGVIAGAASAAGAAVKYLDSHDKALAGIVQKDIAWGQAHIGEIDTITAELHSVEDLIPEHLRDQLAAVTARAEEAMTHATDAVEQVKAAAPASVVDQVTTAVLDRIRAATASPPAPAAPTSPGATAAAGT